MGALKCRLHCDGGPIAPQAAMRAVDVQARRPDAEMHHRLLIVVKLKYELASRGRWTGEGL